MVVALALDVILLIDVFQHIYQWSRHCERFEPRSHFRIFWALCARSAKRNRTRMKTDVEKKIMVEWKIEKESRKKRVCSYLRNRSYLLRKDLLNWSLAEVFFQTLIVTLVTEGFLSPFLCRPIAYSSSLFWRASDWPSCFSRKITICFIFLPFLHTMSATDGTWIMSVFMLLFVYFFFYRPSSYKRAWGQHKAWLGLKVIRHNQAKKKKRNHLARYEGVNGV